MRWRLLCALFAMAVTGVATGGGASAAGSGHACTPAGSRTIVATREARVFSTRLAPRHVEGCLYSRGRIVDLKRAGRLLGSEFPKRPFVLAGRYVAYQMDNTNPDIGIQDQNVLVVDLATGRRAHKVTTIFDRAHPDTSYGVIENLVLRRTGSAAWLARGDATEGGGRVVYRVDSRGVKLLDRSTDIQPRSLRLRRRQLSWIDAGIRRTADLR